jgi:hypothetical protein
MVSTKAFKQKTDEICSNPGSISFDISASTEFVADSQTVCGFQSELHVRCILCGHWSNSNCVGVIVSRKMIVPLISKGIVTSSYMIEIGSAELKQGVVCFCQARVSQLVGVKQCVLEFLAKPKPFIHN